MREKDAMKPYALQSSNPYIFLDIDGVLNTYRHRNHQKEITGRSSIRNWCPDACQNLLLLCREFDADIIVSSNWKDMYGLSELKNYFEFNGIPSGYVTDLTPSEVERHEGAEYRGLEIQQWLNQYAPEDASYLIIDDQSTILSAQKKRFIKVNPEVGFADPGALEKALQILGNGTSK